ncbi:unnamed protein product [Dibothriocephalus latus]|uniref:SWIM-type domain-containing protein n=1 Tax=Dibothriocephalus latus TaxID=60516 RepID=A0A3P7NR70_DIBLA|nr:unnamed protein product [Dibothriocephalus latus]
MSLPDCVISLVALLQSEAVDTEAQECCRRRHYNDRPRHVVEICQMLTTYASEVFLKHLDASKAVKSMSKWVDACSCRFFSNWELPCVHIVNCMAAKGVDPQVVVRGCRWLTTSQQLDVRESIEDPDLQAITSSLADAVSEDTVPVFTEEYKVREVMKLLNPVIAKLVSSDRRRFDKLLRKVDAFIDEINDCTSSDSEDESPSYSLEAGKGVNIGAGPSRVDDMFCAHGFGDDQPGASIFRRNKKRRLSGGYSDEESRL